MKDFSEWLFFRAVAKKCPLKKQLIKAKLNGLKTELRTSMYGLNYSVVKNCIICRCFYSEAINHFGLPKITGVILLINVDLLKSLLKNIMSQ